MKARTIAPRRNVMRLLLASLALGLAAAGSPRTPDADITAAAEALTLRLSETRRDIHRNPELGNRELRTGRLVADRLRALGLEVRSPVATPGLVAISKGGPPGPVVADGPDLEPR